MRRIAALLLGALVLLAALAGCQTKKPVASEEETVKIGVVIPKEEQGWIAGMEYYARQRCEELAARGGVEYELCPCGDSAEMTREISRLRDWGVQALVYYVQFDGMGRAVRELLDADVRVVCVDVGLGLEGTTRVTGDHELLGSRSARYLVEKLGPEGTVIALNDPTAGRVSTLRQKGFEEELLRSAPRMKVETFAARFSREEARQVFGEVLATHPKIDGVFAMDDQVSLGVLDALEAAGRTDVQVITGGGGQQEYLERMAGEEKRWLETALYSPAMAADAVDQAVALARGESTEQTKVIAPEVVDRENVSEYLDPKCPY